MQTILIINDSPEFLALMRDFLGDEGYRPETHMDGAGALEHVKRLRPALIVLDLVLGEIDGWVVLSQLRADPVARELPVILCSAAAERTRRYRETLSDVGVRIVEKPFDLDRFLELVVELIGPPALPPPVEQDGPAGEGEGEGAGGPAVGTAPRTAEPA